jgi:hypothetical protein
MNTPFAGITSIGVGRPEGGSGKSIERVFRSSDQSRRLPWATRRRRQNTSLSVLDGRVQRAAATKEVDEGVAGLPAFDSTQVAQESWDTAESVGTNPWRNGEPLSLRLCRCSRLTGVIGEKKWARVGHQ